MKKIIKTIAVIALLVSLFLLYVQFTYMRVFTAPSVTGITARQDSSIIANGKYLVLGAAHCYTCHMPDSLLEKGMKEPMIGGYVFKTPFAKFYTPNLTSDKETGIGNFTDEQLARAVRYHIKHDNHAMVGFMSYNAMSDDDLTAVISYLRTVAPVKNTVPEHEYNMLGKILMRFMVKPAQPEVQKVMPDSTAEYGKYLAYHVTNCNGCHTQRNATGEIIGQPMAGGNSWDYEDGVYTSPNLTFNDSTGRITNWSQQDFIKRFRRGKLFSHTPMPWGAYQSLSDRDLSALYKFLKSLSPVHKEIKETYTPKTQVAGS
jgi:mono/diheme cytochrome c family protein